MFKIHNHSRRFRAHEMDAIATAVELSIQLLSGNRPEIMESLRSDPQWISEMQKQFFVLNQLHSEFALLKESL